MLELNEKVVEYLEVMAEEEQKVQEEEEKRQEELEKQKKIEDEKARNGPKSFKTFQMSSELKQVSKDSMI